MARIEASREEMFPSLSPGEIDRLRRFGAIRRYAADEPLFMTGDIRSGMFVLVSGSVSLSARDALGHVLPIVELGPGGFLAEVGMLAGQPRLVDARAISDSDVLLIPADRLRTVLITEAEIVGGGNSAGQAAVFLSSFAAKVSILVRDHGLDTSMSRYLIDRIEATDNIEVLARTEVTALIGGPGSHLARVRWRRATTGDEMELPICHLFLFVGVEPATAWLRDCGIVLDSEGFVRTGSEDHTPRPLPLESSIPGVFAVGDVRSGSAKRVGGAIGEGAAVVAQLHTVLAEAPTTGR